MKKWLINIPSIFLITLLAACSSLSSGKHGLRSTQTTGHPPEHIALFLPLTGPLAGPGQAVKDGILAANRQSATPITLKSYDTTRSPISALYQQAIQDKTDLIIGPLDKNSLAALAQQSDTSIPVIALNTTNQSTRNLYQLTLSPQNEAAETAKRAYQDGHRRALIIAPTGAWGNSIANQFATQWRQLGGEVLNTIGYSGNTPLEEPVKHLLAVPSADAVFIVAYPQAARQIVPLIRFHHTAPLDTYAISITYSGTIKPELDSDLNGLVICDMPFAFKEGSVIQAEKSADLKAWSETWNTYSRLYALGNDAYRIAVQWNQVDGGSFSLDGLTGYLSLADHQFHRQLVCARIQEGAPVLL